MSNKNLVIGLGILAVAVASTWYFYNKQNDTSGSNKSGSGGSGGGNDGGATKTTTDSAGSDGNGAATSTKTNSYNFITQVNGKDNYVTGVTSSGSAFGIPFVTVSTSSGQSSTIAAAPDTYYPTVGIGFNSKGDGYSSAAPLKSVASSPVPTPVTATTKTDIPAPKSSAVIDTRATDLFTKKLF